MFKIRYKVLLVLLLVSLLPQIILNQISANAVKGQYLNNMDLVARHQIDTLEQILHATIKENEQLINTMAVNIQYVYGENGEINQNEMNQLIRISQESSGNIPNFYIGTAKGNMYIYPNSSLPVGYDPRIRTWYQQAMLNKGKACWQGPYIDQGSKQLVLTVSKRYFYQNQEGVVGIDIVLSSIRELLDNKSLRTGGETFILDSAGNIVAHPNPSFEGLNVKNTKYQWDGIEKAISLGHYSGKLYRIQTKNIDNGLIIVAVLSNETLKGDIAQLLWQSRMAPLLFMALTMGLAFAFSHQLTKPVYKVIKAMESIDYGNFNAKVQLDGNDEMTMLAKSFNQMSDNLFNAHQEMTALYEELSASEETLKEQYDELIQNRDQISKSEKRLSTIFEMSNEGLWELRENTFIVHSPHWFRNFVKLEQELDLEKWEMMIHPEDLERWRSALGNHVKGITPYCHEIYRVKDLSGQYKYIETKAKYRDGIFELPVLVGTNLDITEQKRNEEEILKMVYFDSMTGLANRRNFEREIEMRLDKHQWGHIIYMDIERFKAINEAKGYHYGDKILNDLTRRLHENFEGNFMARIAGDEFVIILEEHYEEDKIADLIVDFSENRCCELEINNELLSYKLHIVSCKYPNDGRTIEELYVAMQNKIKEVKSLKLKNES